jgi:hypothetical protein
MKESWQIPSANLSLTSGVVQVWRVNLDDLLTSPPLLFDDKSSSLASSRLVAF